MGLTYQNLNSVLNSFGFIPKGSGAVQKTFTDNFTRANNAANWGNQWGDFNIEGSSAGVAVLSSINTNVGLLTGPNGNTAQKVMLPIPLMWLSQTPGNQFSQITLGTFTSTVFGIGPIVVCCPAMGSGSINQGFYYAQWNATNIQINRVNWNGGAQTSVTLTTIAATVTVGDILRLNATLSGSTWTLTALKNGTSIGSTTDTGLSQGMPGLTCVEANAGVLHTAITNYQGGAM